MSCPYDLSLFYYVQVFYCDVDPLILIEGEVAEYLNAEASIRYVDGLYRKPGVVFKEVADPVCDLAVAASSVRLSALLQEPAVWAWEVRVSRRGKRDIFASQAGYFIHVYLFG